jgi:hypothetical protein
MGKSDLSYSPSSRKPSKGKQFTKRKWKPSLSKQSKEQWMKSDASSTLVDALMASLVQLPNKKVALAQSVIDAAAQSASALYDENLALMHEEVKKLKSVIDRKSNMVEELKAELIVAKRQARATEQDLLAFSQMLSNQVAPTVQSLRVQNHRLQTDNSCLERKCHLLEQQLKKHTKSSRDDTESPKLPITLDPSKARLAFLENRVGELEKQTDASLLLLRASETQIDRLKQENTDLSKEVHAFRNKSSFITHPNTVTKSSGIPGNSVAPNTDQKVQTIRHHVARLHIEKVLSEQTLRSLLKNDKEFSLKWSETDRLATEKFLMDSDQSINQPTALETRLQLLETEGREDSAKTPKAKEWNIPSASTNF